MDSEASNRHPDRSKRKQKAQVPSNSMQDSNLTIPVLPAELITEILSRLPVKPLLKFKSVSKSWLDLISSPEFMKTHLSLSANNNKKDPHHLLIFSRSGTNWSFKECSLRSLFYDCAVPVAEAFDLDYPFENVNKIIRFAGSCNGLILLADYSEYSLLWNPTIRKYKNLPDFRPRCKESYARYGFGYDDLHDDYKVLGVFYKYMYEGSDDVEVKLYSLKSDSWTSVDYCGDILNTSGSYGKIKLIGSGLFVNGKLHWDTITECANECLGRNIISFDLANEKWEKMEKPSYEVGESDLCLGMLGSDLCVFSTYKGTHLGAWVMNDYGVKESWIKKFTVRCPNDRSLCPPFFKSNKGEILARFGSTFMIYNSKDDSLRLPDVINYNTCHHREIYVESLVCPFSTEG